MDEHSDWKGRLGQLREEWDGSAGNRRVIDHLHLGKSERAKATGILKVCVHACVCMRMCRCTCEYVEVRKQLWCLSSDTCHLSLTDDWPVIPSHPPVSHSSQDYKWMSPRLGYMGAGG